MNPLGGFGFNTIKQLLTKRNSSTQALQLQDTTQGSAVGGNPRGIGAVDMQMTRTAANQVASGNFSVAFGQNNLTSGNSSSAIGNLNIASGDSSFTAGFQNTASGLFSIAIGTTNNATGQAGVAIGQANTSQGTGVAVGFSCSASNGAISLGVSNAANGAGSVAIGEVNTINGTAATGIGRQNTAAGQTAVALGSQNSAGGVAAVALGNSNTASGDRSFAAGQTNTANGVESVAIGVRGTANAISAIQVYGFNVTTVGQTQKSELGVYNTSVGRDGTPTILTVFAAAATATNQLTLRNNSVFAVTGKVVARDTANNDSAMWEYAVLIKRGANAAATTIVGTPTITRLFADTAAVTGMWEVSLVADTTNGALQIRVLGEAGKTIRWAAVHDTVEVA